MNLKETQKLLYLERILKLYVRFLKAYNDVKLEIITKDYEEWLDTVTQPNRDGVMVTRDVRIASYFDPKDFVRVKYTNPKINTYIFQAIEFPMEDLSKRIKHYKNKLFIAFKNRHNRKKESYIQPYEIKALGFSPFHLNTYKKDDLFLEVGDVTKLYTKGDELVFLFQGRLKTKEELEFILKKI